MAEAFKKLYQGQPGTSAGTIYTVPAATQTIVKHMRFVNTSASTTTLILYRGGTAAVNQILPALSLGAGEWAEWDGSMALAATETIASQAGAATAITVTIDGVEIT